MRREFLQLAHTYKPDKHKIAGWYVSEKVDGTRCFWDGGISRGMATEQVPWASTINPKTGEPKSKIKPVSSGLWSRYGNPIMAPEEFLDKLPPFPVDGELWAGRGNFQLCRSVCGGDSPDPRFGQISFAIFSAPPLESVFASGEIKNTNFHKTLNYKEIKKWIKQFSKGIPATPSGATFEEEMFALRSWKGWCDQVYIHPQTLLPNDEDEAREMLGRMMDRFLDQGGEGTILRSPQNVWVPKRVHDILKAKPWNDAEGTVVGFTSGRKTDKGSKLLGLIGALVLDYNGQRLELAGLTNEEREFEKTDHSAYAVQHPGEDMPGDFQGKHFKLGDTVTFKYRELSDDGIPKEARYWRKRGVE